MFFDRMSCIFLTSAARNFLFGRDASFLSSLAVKRREESETQHSVIAAGIKTGAEPDGTFPVMENRFISSTQTRSSFHALSSGTNDCWRDFLKELFMESFL